MAPRGLAKGPSLYRLAWYRTRKSGWSNERGSMLRLWELLLNLSVGKTTVRIDTNECKIGVGTCIPAAKVVAGSILWVME